MSQTRFEYAISCGQGTLLDHGVRYDGFLEACRESRVNMGQNPNREMVEFIPRMKGRIKVRFRPAPYDCKTGE